MPSELHRSIAKLPFSLILTTKHDPVMEVMLREEVKQPVADSMRVSQRENPEQGHRPSVAEPLLFKLLGDSTEPESLILGENDILDIVSL